MIFSESGLAIRIWPSITYSIISDKFTKLEGYGLNFRTERLSLEYYKTTYISRKSSGLIWLPGGVYKKSADLWKVNYAFFKKNGFVYGLGFSKLSINDNLNYYIFLEKRFDEPVFVRLEFAKYTIEKEPINMIMISFGIDILKSIKLFVDQEIKNTERKI